MSETTEKQLGLAEKIEQKPLSEDLINTLADVIVKIEKESISTQRSDSQTISCLEGLILEKVNQELEDEI